MPFVRDWKRVLRRAFFESIIPLLGGIGWAIFAYFERKSAFEIVSAFGVGFFFILALQGQFLRVAKNVRDEQDAEDFHGHFSTLQEAIDDIRARLPTAAAGKFSRARTHDHAELSRGPADFTFEVRPQRYQNYLLQASGAASSGHFIAGAVTAAVAFEYAAREIARSRELPTEQMPLGRILRELSKDDQKKFDTFMTLNRLRNSLVHSEGDLSSMTREQAQEMISAFANGIASLR